MTRLLPKSRARGWITFFLLYGALEAMMLQHAGRNERRPLLDAKAIDLDRISGSATKNSERFTEQRRYPEAIAELTKAKELSHGNSEAIASIGYVEAVAGDTAKAQAILDELKTSPHYISPASIALVYTGWVRRKKPYRG